MNSIVKLLSLTRPATLLDVQEAEKDPILQIIRAELSELRSEFRAALQVREAPEHISISTKDRSKEVNRRSGKDQIRLEYISLSGLESFFVNILGIEDSFVDEAFNRSASWLDFLSQIAGNTKVLESDKEFIMSLVDNNGVKKCFIEAKRNKNKPAKSFQENA